MKRLSHQSVRDRRVNAEARSLMMPWTNRTISASHGTLWGDALWLAAIAFVLGIIVFS